MPNIIISPEQCRAARELVNWTQQDLSSNSALSQAAISNFETGKTNREVRVGTIMDIVNAFEEAGIRFFNEEGRIGVFIEKS